MANVTRPISDSTLPVEDRQAMYNQNLMNCKTEAKNMKDDTSYSLGIIVLEEEGENQQPAVATSPSRAV